LAQVVRIQHIGVSHCIFYNMAWRFAWLATIDMVVSSAKVRQQCSTSSSSGDCSLQAEAAASSDHLLLQLSRASLDSLHGPARHVDEFVPLSAFFWNVHWECSMGARGASKDCKSHIGRRFRELATASQADVVTSIELADSASRPTRLKRFGFDGWTQVDGPCKKSRFNGDAAALALAPGWTVQGSAGGCLRRDSDSRAFAVARVRPPTAVKGCPSLCVVALHAPHQAIDHGKELVRDVCGSLVDNCTVAMGDWNAPAEDIGSLWEQLIGGNVPVEAKPNERTCCWPESHHYGIFDHLATNIPGAIHDNHTVHPYQLLHLSPMKQHKAVSARLLLPREA